MVLVVNDKQPYKTLKEFVDDVKKRPNELVFSSSGMYGALHLPTALFMKAAGIQMRHLPTQGGGPAVTALLGNNSQVQASAIAAIISQIKAGKARALAVFGAQRSAALPDVPTLKEVGYDIEFYLWVGLFAPKGTPDAIVTKLREETRKAVATDQFKGGDDQPRAGGRLSGPGRVQGVLGRRRQARRRSGAGSRQGGRMTACPGRVARGQRT